MRPRPLNARHHQHQARQRAGGRQNRAHQNRPAPPVAVGKARNRQLHRKARDHGNHQVKRNLAQAEALLQQKNRSHGEKAVYQQAGDKAAHQRQRRHRQQARQAHALARRQLRRIEPRERHRQHRRHHQNRRQRENIIARRLQAQKRDARGEGHIVNHIVKSQHPRPRRRHAALGKPALHNHQQAVIAKAQHHPQHAPRP